MSYGAVGWLTRLALGVPAHLSSTVAAIDQRAKDDPDFAAAVEAELQAMHIESKYSLHLQQVPVSGSK